MKTSKKLTILGAVSLIAGAAVIMQACNKEKPLQSAAGSTHGGPTLETRTSCGGVSAPAFTKTYMADYNSTSTNCTCSPIYATNGLAEYFNMTTGTGQTTVNNLSCYATGISQSPLSCQVNVANGTSASGSSTLSYLDNAGNEVYIADLVDASGNPFYVEEMEFMPSGDLYFLKKGDYQNLYKATSADVTDGSPTITASAVGAMFSNNLSKRMSLCVNGSQLRLVAELPALTITTTLYNVNTSTAALTGVATYNVPGAGTFNISTYYYSGDLYLLRNAGTTGSGTLYKLNVVYPTTVPSVGTVTCFNTHDLCVGGSLCF